MNIIHNVPSYVKVEPYGNTVKFDATVNGGTKTVNSVAGDILDFYFPTGYIDLKSLAMMFKYYTIGTTSGTAQALPKDTECLIDRLEVHLGNTKIHDIANYNQIFFLLSSYAFDAEFGTQRAQYRNVYTNGRPAAATTLDGVRFCCDKWLGLLGQNIVLDTHNLGQLRIRITLAPSAVTSSNSAANSWGLSDIYFKVKYIENYYGELPKYIEFENFKSIKTQRSNYTQTTNFIMSCKQLDYVLARPLFASHLTKSTINTDLLSSAYFASTGEMIGHWNILINNNPVFKYRTDSQDALNTINDIFPHACKNIGVQSQSEQSGFNRSWVCGSEIGFVNEKNEQIEIGFVTEPQGSGFSTICYPLVIAKCTSTINLHPAGGFHFTF